MPEKFLAKTSLLLNLSRIDQWIETFGLTILEAMYFGIPCIVPNLGGPTEIIDHGINGFCISSYEVESIYNKIKELSKDPFTSKILSKNAKIKSEFFSREKFQDSILRFLNNVNE